MAQPATAKSLRKSLAPENLDKQRETTRLARRSRIPQSLRRPIFDIWLRQEQLRGLFVGLIEVRRDCHQRDIGIAVPLASRLLRMYLAEFLRRASFSAVYFFRKANRDGIRVFERDFQVIGVFANCGERSMHMLSLKAGSLLGEQCESDNLLSVDICALSSVSIRPSFDGNHRRVGSIGVFSQTRNPLGTISTALSLLLGTATIYLIQSKKNSKITVEYQIAKFNVLFLFFLLSPVMGSLFCMCIFLIDTLHSLLPSFLTSVLLHLP